nr:hypothetical protein [Tanacetum cinerariifolium]
QTITVTIGSPGVGGAASAGTGNTGTAGGALTVTNMSGANLVLSGGAPGGGGASSNNGAFISGGGLLAPGFPLGAYGGDTDGTQPTCIGGAGGSSPFGGGGGGGQYSKPSATYTDSAEEGMVEGVIQNYAIIDLATNIVDNVAVWDGVLSANTYRRNSLLAAATLAIDPLQDAVDLDMATDADLVMLKAWKLYRVNVNRVDLKVLAPAWPTQPV